MFSFIAAFFLFLNGSGVERYDQSIFFSFTLPDFSDSFLLSDFRTFWTFGLKLTYAAYDRF
jgi:hypothetical protein